MCDRSSVTWVHSMAVGSQVGAYGTISRPPARSGNMFSTAKITSVSASMAATPASKPSA